MVPEIMASPLVQVAAVKPYLGNIGELNADAGRSIKSYLERMDIFLQANEIPANKRVSVFLSFVGVTTYDLLRSLCSPAKSQSICHLERALAHFRGVSLPQA